MIFSCKRCKTLKLRNIFAVLLAGQAIPTPLSLNESWVSAKGEREREGNGSGVEERPLR